MKRFPLEILNLLRSFKICLLHLLNKVQGKYIRKKSSMVHLYDNSKCTNGKLRDFFFVKIRKTKFFDIPSFRRVQIVLNSSLKIKNVNAKS